MYSDKIYTVKSLYWPFFYFFYFFEILKNCEVLTRCEVGARWLSNTSEAFVWCTLYEFACSQRKPVHEYCYVHGGADLIVVPEIHTDDDRSQTARHGDGGWATAVDRVPCNMLYYGPVGIVASQNRTNCLLPKLRCDWDVEAMDRYNESFITFASYTADSRYRR